MKDDVKREPQRLETSFFMKIGLVSFESTVHMSNSELYRKSYDLFKIVM